MPKSFSGNISVLLLLSVGFRDLEIWNLAYFFRLPHAYLGQNRQENGLFTIVSMSTSMKYVTGTITKKLFSSSKHPFFVLNEKPTAIFVDRRPSFDNIRLLLLI